MARIEFYNEMDFEALYRLFCDWDKEYHFDYQVFIESLHLAANDPSSKILVAKEDDAIIGYAQICRSYLIGFEPFYEVAQLLVVEAKRSKGVGKALMLRIEEIALSEGIHMIKLSSQIHRSRAHLFYEGLGFGCFKVSKFYAKKLSN